ncbi:MAG: DUF222 domain-containing protein [Actinophytocola sp.]|nr:DUF222 domain-containing protein [Actinophytocola sp.]
MSEPASLPFAPGAAWHRADRAALVTALRETETMIRRAQAIQGEILAEMQSRGVPQTFGYADVEAVVKDLVRCDRPEAKARVRRALACNEYTEGAHRIAASAPATAAAYAEGAIGSRHIDSIVKTLAEMPGAVPEEERLGYEKILADLARESSPAAVDRAGRHLLERIEQDHLARGPAKPLPPPPRELNWAWNRDRQLCVAGRLDAVSGALFEKLLSPLAKPRLGPDGERDTRPIDQRHGDAFAELLDHAQRAADLPTEAGETPALVLTMNLADLIPAQRTGSDGGTMRGQQPPMVNGDMPIPASEARLLACDSRVIPAVLGSSGEVLDLGRETRLATTPQRRALGLRDRGCVFPGCTRPSNWCHAHHAMDWSQGGSSDLNNLILLCGMHHRLIHHSEWTIRMAADGKPDCIPPPWLDIKQRPRRNHTFHPIAPDTS